MNFKSSLLLIIGVMLFISGYYVANRKDYVQIESLKKEHTDELVTMQKKLAHSIEMNQKLLTVSERNNIVKTVTVYKANGERVVSKVVDRSMKKVVTEESTTKKQINTEVNSSRHMVGETVAENKSISRVSSYQYIIGLSGLQLLNGATKLADSLNIDAGLRIANLPIFVTTQAPIKSDFYKNLSFGISIEL